MLILGCAALWPAAAEAQDSWRPVVTSCVSDSGSAGCADGRSIDGAWNTIVSADGRHAYTAAFDAAAIGVFDRDPATGALKQKPGAAGCIAETGGECRDGRALTSPDGIAISPDGRFAYVSTWQNAVAVLDRDTGTGELSQRAAQNGCISNSGTPVSGTNTCLDGHGLSSSAGSLEVSPDGRHLYVGTNPVAVLTRDPVDGTLSQDPGAAGCVSTPATDGCTSVRGLGSGRQPASSRDGRNLYVPTGSGIAVFDRVPGSGQLVQKDGGLGCLSAAPVNNTCALEPRLAGTFALVVSPDDRQLYATTSSGVVTLDRAPDGVVKVRGCISEPAAAGCATGTNVRNLAYAAISPDGRDLVATRFAPGGLAIFSRDPSTGDLAQRPGPDGCLSGDGSAADGTPGACRAHPSIGEDMHVSFASDSVLYSGGYTPDAVAAIKRDFFPTCSDAGANVPHNASAPVALSCGDRNGDPVALSIAGAPRSGSLGAIDQAQGRVLYDPFGGFSGADEFTFKAEAAGLESAPARASLNVAPPAAATPQPTPPRRVNSAVSSRWGVRGKRIFLLALAVKSPPRGAQAELRCRGGRCPFARRRVRRPRRGALTLFRAVNAQKAARAKARTFRAGQTLELRITAAGRIGKAVRFKLRKGKIPTGRQGCLPLDNPRFRTRC